MPLAGLDRQPNRARLAVPLTALGIVATVLIGRLLALNVRKFDPDEFEHMHVGWCVSKGLVMFRDFFEAHTPVFHSITAALSTVLHPESSSANAFRALFA